MKTYKIKSNLLCFIIVLLHFACLAPIASAQTGKFYTTDEGLSSSLINQIFQDSRGYIWVATEYGLNRFDGNQFVSYYQLTGKTGGIKSSDVRTMYETGGGDLFVGCIDGLMRY